MSYRGWEWLNCNRQKILEVSRILRKGVLVQLTAVVGKDEEAQCRLQGMKGTATTTGGTRQPR
jgi:hypothetical protein